MMLVETNNLKLTENGDIAFENVGNDYLDILFKTAYYEKHLNSLPALDNSPLSKLFAMFIRDPRYGLGRRDLGRVLMKNTEVNYKGIVKAGRYDDLLVCGSLPRYRLWLQAAKDGDVLAKKWLPRLTGKNGKQAKQICKDLNLKEKEYRQIIKCTDTVEYKLSYAESLYDDLGLSLKVFGHPLVDQIDFSKVPSQAMLKYWNLFKTRNDFAPRFEKYLEDVKSGKSKVNVSTTTVYDIYKNRAKVDADLLFDQIEKIEINCIPIIDTSDSMHDRYDSYGKALSIGHYLGTCSTFAKGLTIPFSSNPHLMPIRGNTYEQQLRSLDTGDWSNTDLGKVMELLSDLKKYPDYLIVLSDMQFDYGSLRKKDALMKDWKSKGIQTKIVWWNFCADDSISPETDEYGNIFMSGYSPQLLKFLECGFDGIQFLQKLLIEYKKKIAA